IALFRVVTATLFISYYFLVPGMAVESVRKGDDYNTIFDSSWYLKNYHSSPKGDPEERGHSTFLYEELHQTYSSGRFRFRASSLDLLHGARPDIVQQVKPN
ncbi:unnamed protein product, partial [Owenia fusiformis]